MTISAWVAPEDLDNYQSSLAPSACQLASRILYNLTGRIYGGVKTTTETYLPAVGSTDPLLLYTLAQYGIGTIHRFAPMRIGLNGEMRIPLRRRPIVSVSLVQTAIPNQIPTTISSTLYDWNSSYLTVQSLVPVMIGLTVSYSYGTAPPTDGVSAAKALADELVMLFSNIEDSQDTRLKNVTSLTRNGVAIQIEDARTIFTDGRTGIPEVDLFVASVNPGRAKLRSRVFSPDAHFVR